MASVGKRKSVKRQQPLNSSDEESSTSDAVQQRQSPKKAKPTQEKDSEQDVNVPPKPLNEEEEEDDFLGEEGGVRIGDIYIPPPPPAPMGVDVNGPRLIITHIVNENFKSYAGKTVLGPFHKCFSSIVGPNGSGKSNVIDSMLFVFGYRASKIRSKKISVLLHNSDQHRNIQSCTVAVHFKLIVDKPGDEFEVVPGSEVVIARTAFRDNSSFYTINEKRVQFKEVAKKLRSYGIDLDHNRFLILQGEVEQIAMMKPKGQTEHDTGMLEFLEDIIGTSRFKEPIEKLSVMVENLNEERTEKLNRVKMVEKEKELLEGPKDEAIKALKKENTFSLTMHLHCQKYLHNINLEIARNEEKKKEIDDEMKGLREDLEKVQATIKEKEAIINTGYKQLEKMTAQKEGLSEQFNKLNNKDVQIITEIQQNNKKRKKTQEQVAEEKKKLAELQKIPEKNAAEIEELKALEPKLAEQSEKEQKEVEAVRAKIAVEASELTEKKRKLANELVHLTAAANDQRSKLDIARKELDIYLHSENTAKQRFEDLKTAYEDAVEKVNLNKNTVAELKKKVPRMEKELNNMKGDLDKVAGEQATINQQLQQQRTAVEEIKSDQAATKSRNVCLNFLMDQKRQGKIPGIIGRLGDLGGIDQKYDVAVSTSSPLLDHILVETVQSGEMCIDALKKYNVGRASFIILQKQEHLSDKANTPMVTPENVPRLYDLIRIREDRFKTAFYFAMRDTLVAEDLEQATRIGYGHARHRVVTLNGELIEPSGTMTGGGRQKIRGRMGSSSKRDVGVSEKDFTAMEERLERLRTRSDELSTQVAQLHAGIREHNQTIASDKATLKMAEVELQTLTEQMPDREVQLKQQKQKVKESVADEKQVKVLQTKLNAIQKDVDKAEEAENKVAKQVQELTEEIEKLTSGRVRSAQKKLDAVNNQLAKVRTEITRLGVAIKTSERNAIKTQDKITNMTQDIEDIGQQMVKMVEEKNALTVEADKVCKMLETVQTGLQEKEAEVKELKTVLASDLDQENELKSSKMDFDQRISAVEEYISEKKHAMKFTNAKLKKLTLHHIPGAEKQDEFVMKTPEELEEIDAENLQYEVSRLEGVMSKHQPNTGAIEEYNRKEAQYLQRVGELEAVTNRRNEIRNHHDEIRKKRLLEFMAGFTTITEKLKEMYQMITLGGDAELELVDSLDPFVEGIVFSVRPPKKSWKNISNLSGGEKTLSSLALVFALHYYKPTPLYVMDEIDAALDFKNVSIVANYIKERTKNAQFIIISLRSNMFELADLLVGIFKTYNCTKAVTINPKLYENPDMCNANPNRDQEKRKAAVMSSELAASKEPHLQSCSQLPDGSNTSQAPVPEIRVPDAST